MKGVNPKNRMRRSTLVEAKTGAEHSRHWAVTNDTGSKAEKWLEPGHTNVRKPLYAVR